ncbi:MAG: hypothetical protein ACOYK8_08080 [Alphaproteobacteria bacterium]
MSLFFDPLGETDKPEHLGWIAAVFAVIGATEDGREMLEFIREKNLLIAMAENAATHQAIRGFESLKGEKQPIWMMTPHKLMLDQGADSIFNSSVLLLFARGAIHEINGHVVHGDLEWQSNPSNWDHDPEKLRAAMFEQECIADFASFKNMVHRYRENLDYACTNVDKKCLDYLAETIGDLFIEIRKLKKMGEAGAEQLAMAQERWDCLTEVRDPIFTAELFDHYRSLYMQPDINSDIEYRNKMFDSGALTNAPAVEAKLYYSAQILAYMEGTLTLNEVDQYFLGNKPSIEPTPVSTIPNAPATKTASTAQISRLAFR